MCEVFRGISAEVHTEESVKKLKQKAVDLLVEWQSTAAEEHLTGAQLHVMLHVIEYIIDHGPATDSWCFRRAHHCCRSARTARVASSIAALEALAAARLKAALRAGRRLSGST
jgi:hypothetical protein